MGETNVTQTDEYSDHRRRTAVRLLALLDERGESTALEAAANLATRQRFLGANQVVRSEASTGIRKENQ